MSALNWSDRYYALLAVSATGELAAVGDTIAAKLATGGAAYDARYAASGVAASKTAWLIAAFTAWVNAAHVARTFMPPPPAPPEPDPTPVPTFDEYHLPTLAAFVASASPVSSVEKQILAAAFATVRTLWNPNRTDPTGDPFDSFLKADVTSSSIVEFDQVKQKLTITASRTINADSVRTLELALAAVVDEALSYIAALS